MQSNINCSNNEKNLNFTALELSINQSLTEITRDIKAIERDAHGGTVTSEAMGKLFSNQIFIQLLPQSSPNKENMQQTNADLLRQVQTINGKKSPNAEMRRFFGNNS